MRRIEDLLDKYFEGETSAAEEQELRQFFASDAVPEHLRIHQPLFAYFAEEIRKEEATTVRRQMPQRRRVLLWVSGVAAAVLLLLGIGQVYVFPGRTFCSDNYVVINGRCYTDPHTIREHALNALQEISTSERDLFPVISDDDDRQVIEEQFRALGSFFSDDDE
ncbi:hypothetical protein [Parabacteroides sp. PF5-6]|uniref:hypothetical protein n=1 Tax=Parabacteroides sp. PF5-6 TaxID=1742403 RepID=UPI0024057E51|nr:hypothetical protein [Parabacteroides sp. PF5-6]MDF9830084.1 hypothetical protein [Parabacteroides sp. PF5-6]